MDNVPSLADKSNNFASFLTVSSNINTSGSISFILSNLKIYGS